MIKLLAILFVLWLFTILMANFRDIFEFIEEKITGLPSWARRLGLKPSQLQELLQKDL